MTVRFSKILDQMLGAARPKSEWRHLHPQEIIRAREAAGDRITMFLGMGLTISAIAFPVYAINANDGKPDLPSVLPPINGALPVNKSLAAGRLHLIDFDPVATGSVAKTKTGAETTNGGVAQSIETRSLPPNYVLWSVNKGIALVEGPGGLRAVVPGATLPGAGQILSIEQASTGWVVVTSETVIGEQSSMRL
jgi:hypothetical protein